MIAWWGWVLIWGGLVLALVATLALVGWRLVRRFLAVVSDFFALTEKVAILDGVLPEANDRSLNAVLEESAVVRRQFDARMLHRANRKLARRQARIQRAKMITTAVVDPKEWPHVW